MLRVKRVHTQDVDYKLHNLIYKHCINVELPNSLLAKHYSGTKLAAWLSTHAGHGFMYILYSEDTPIGLMCFSEVSTVHMDCTCIVEDLLFIKEDSRSIKNLFTLVKEALKLLTTEFQSTYLVFVGSTLGPSSLPELYIRLGFSQVGTHLVKEYQYE